MYLCNLILFIYFEGGGGGANVRPGVEIRLVTKWDRGPHLELDWLM